MKLVKKLGLVCVLFLAGCAPKMTYRIASGTDLVLPFGGSANWSEVGGKIGSGTFEGAFGVIRISRGNLYFKQGEEWDEYSEVSKYYKIELNKNNKLIFDGKELTRTRTVSENEI